MQAPGAAPISSDEPPFVPRSRVWPVLAVLFALALLVAGLLWRVAHAPKPSRVLIAFDVDGYWWEGSEPAAVLSDQLGERLTKLGFEVVKAGDPEVTKILEKAKSPVEAAKALQAGFVIEGKLAPELIEHAKIGFFELRVDTKVTVTFTGEAPKEAGRIHGFSGAKDAKVARRLLASSMADQAFDIAVPAVLAHPVMKEILSKRATGEAATLAPAKEFAEKRDSMTKNALDSYEKLRKQRLDAEQGSVKPTYLSPPSAHDELSGVTPLGWLRSANDIRPFYVAGAQKMGWIYELEALEWRGIDDPNKVVPLWQGYNLYGYPSAEPLTGAPVVFVEDLFGWAKTLTVVDKAGKVARVRVDTSHRFIDPRVAPGGKYVAMWDRACQTCASNLMAMLIDGTTMLNVSQADGPLAAYAWLDGHSLMVLSHPKIEVALPDEKPDTKKPEPKKGDKLSPPKGEDDEDEPKIVPQHLFRYDLDVAPIPRTLVAKAKPGTSFGAPSADRAGKRLVLETTSGALAVLTLGTAEVMMIPVEGRASSPSFSPDGTWITFVLHGGDGFGEIAAVPSAGGTVRVLTKNVFRDRMPVFSSDGARILYETIDDDPTFPKDRLIVWIASVPAPR